VSTVVSEKLPEQKRCDEKKAAAAAEEEKEEH